MPSRAALRGPAEGYRGSVFAPAFLDAESTGDRSSRSRVADQNAASHERRAGVPPLAAHRYCPTLWRSAVMPPPACGRDPGAALIRSHGWQIKTRHLMNGVQEFLLWRRIVTAQRFGGPL